MRRRIWILILSLLLPTAAVPVVAEPLPADPGPRYLARFSDGSIFYGDVLTDWHETDAQPRLDDRKLLDPENPLRWMWDRRQGTQPSPQAYLELWNGDRLPGSTVTYQPAQEAVQPRRACWHVRPGMGLRPPHPATDTLVRVQARFVRRIVWRSRRAGPYQPGTAVLRGGGRVAYRSVRLTPQAALLLLDDGTRRVAFADLDELHLPWQDPWPLLFAELGTLTPQGKTRMLQLETGDGLLATASMNRFAAYALGGSKYSDRWVHGIQPVWSQDILWIPCGNIRMRRMWDPDEQPLCRVPAEPESTSAAASTWPPRVNGNVQGSLLRSGGQVFGWGFGVHAPEVLAFPLPDLPMRLSGSVGLDNLAGSGGCVQVRILANSATDAAANPSASGPAGDLPRDETGSRDETGDVLFESPVMVGSEELASFQAIRIPRISGGSPRLRFLVDTAHAQRPSGADPFDLRDIVDWAEPVLRFEPTSLGPLVAGQAAREIAAWDGWTPHVPEDAAWRSNLRETAGQPGEFQNAVALDKSPLSLIRRMRWTPRGCLAAVGDQPGPSPEGPPAGDRLCGRRTHP
jgi:hypothetical protein